MLCKTPDRARCVVPNSDDEIGETTQQLIGVQQSDYLFTVRSYESNSIKSQNSPKGELNRRDNCDF